MALSHLDLSPEQMVSTEDDISPVENREIEIPNVKHHELVPEVAANEIVPIGNDELSTPVVATEDVHLDDKNPNQAIEPITPEVATEEDILPVETLNVKINEVVAIEKYKLSTTGAATEEVKVDDKNTNDMGDPGEEVPSERERYLNNKRLCTIHGFKQPIHYRKFKTMEFRYVATFNSNDLQQESRFLTTDKLNKIPRKISKPFCHPGPEKKCELYDWYLADSIVQKVYVKTILFRISLCVGSDMEIGTYLSRVVTRQIMRWQLYNVHLFPKFIQQNMKPP